MTNQDDINRQADKLLEDLGVSGGLEGLEGIEPGQQSGIVNPGRSHKQPEPAPTPEPEAKAGRGRPKKPDRRQASFDDYIVEDADIAALLDTVIEGESIAIRVRQAKREIKKLVEAGYPEAINSDQDGLGSGYVNCLGRRFWAGVIDTKERDQKAKKIPSRRSWQPLDAHRSDLFTLTKPDA